MSTREAAVERSGLRSAMAVFAALLALAGFFFFQGKAKDAVLEVQVTPAGATVELKEPLSPGDGPRVLRANAGLVTFDHLPRGALAKVVASAPGHRQAVATQALHEDGSPVRLVLNLEAEHALVSVATDPEEALVYLDNTAVGVSPVVLTTVVAGNHVISARKPGFQPATQTIQVKASENRQVLLTLEPTGDDPTGDKADGEPDDKPPPGYGRIHLKSSHRSTFYADNFKIAVGQDVWRTIIAGPHNIYVRCDGRGAKYKNVEIIEGETTEAFFEFNEDPTAKAREALDDTKPLYWVARGGPTRNSGKYGDAVKMFQKALELDPDYAQAHRQLATTLPALKEWDAAIYHMERYLELDPAVPNAEFYRGMIKRYQEEKEKEEAGH